MTLEASREDQYVAALCHVSLLVPLGGLALPLVVWLMRRKESAYLRFQAAQSLAYQAAGLVAQFLLYGLQMGLSFGFMAIMIGLVTVSSASHASATVANIIGFVFLLLWIAMMLFFALQCIGGLLYIVFGLWGALQIIRGRAFRYPILGKFIDRRLNPPPPVLDSQPLTA